MSKRRTRKPTKQSSVLSTIPTGKWVKGVGPDMATWKVARECLRLRFETVLYWLPRAAEHPEKDIENVHQLRVSLRRVTTNLRAFRALLEQEPYRALRESFRAVLTGAGAARDADVLLTRFRLTESEPSSGVRNVIARLEEERRAAQETILAAYREFPPERLNEQFEETTRLLRKKPRKADKVEPRFGKFARHLLVPFVERFESAYRGIGAEIAELHAFRVAGKKLRYALEIASPAFAKAARRDVYRNLVSLQDYLGMLNDHHQMIVRLENWPGPDGVVEGMIASERMIVADLWGMFSPWWPNEKHERFMESLETLITSRKGA